MPHPCPPSTGTFFIALQTEHVAARNPHPPSADDLPHLLTHDARRTTPRWPRLNLPRAMWMRVDAPGASQNSPPRCSAMKHFPMNGPAHCTEAGFPMICITQQKKNRQTQLGTHPGPAAAIGLEPNDSRSAGMNGIGQGRPSSKGVRDPYNREEWIRISVTEGYDSGGSDSASPDRHRNGRTEAV